MDFPTILLKRDPRDIARPYYETPEWEIIARDGAPIEYTIRAGMLETRVMPEIDGAAQCALVVSPIRAATPRDDQRATFSLNPTMSLAMVDPRARFAHDEETCDQLTMIDGACRRMVNDPRDRSSGAISLISAVRVTNYVSRGTAIPAVTHNSFDCRCYINSMQTYGVIEAEIGPGGAHAMSVYVPQMVARVYAGTAYTRDGIAADRDTIITAIQRGGGGAGADGAVAHVTVRLCARYGGCAGGSREMCFIAAPYFRAERVTITSVAEAAVADVAAPPPYPIGGSAPYHPRACPTATIAPPATPAPRHPPRAEDRRDACAMVHPRDPAWTCAEPRVAGSTFCARHAALIALI